MMGKIVFESPTSPSFPLLSERTSVIAPLSDRRGGVRLFAKEQKVRLFIEYNRGYIDYAKQNRKKPTRAEDIFWHIVKDRKLFGYKFRRQKCIGPFILDFYCSELLLGIELDGGYHDDRVDYDIYRDAEIYKKGIVVIRFKNEDIEKNIEGVVSELENIIKKNKKRFFSY